MLEEQHSSRAAAEAVAAAIAHVTRCRVDLFSKTHDLEAARAARAALDDTDLDSVIHADEAVRVAFRARGAASDRLEYALDVLARRQREATQ